MSPGEEEGVQLYLQLKVVQLYLGVFARVSRDLTTCNGDAEIEARSYCNLYNA